MKNSKALTIAIVVLLTQVATARNVEKLKLPDGIAEKTTCLNPEFLFYRPKGVDASKEAPLLVYLHGLVRRGSNVDSLRIVGKWMLFANVEKQKIVLVIPQCAMDPKGGKKGSGRWNADDVELLVEYLKKSQKIDEDRIYLAGYSMGAFGTWACAVSYPKTFAAIATVAGGGDPRTAGTIKHLPIWVFHGKKDTRVPHKGSEDMVDALKKAGARNVRFTSYPDQGHGRTFGKALNDPELYKWFRSHSRNKKSARPIRKPKAQTRPRPKPTSRPKRTDEDKARSQLTLAKNYIESGLKTKAVDALRQLIDKYPKTRTAKTAAAELEKLGKK